MIGSFEEFKASLRDSREVYYRGKAVTDVTEHPVLKLEMEPVKYMFKDEYRFFNQDFDVESSIFYRIPRNSEELTQRSQMTYNITKELGILWPHIGSDALLAAKVGTCELDTAERFAKFHEYVVKNNLFVCGAQIDVKGDRRKRPTEQNDPDMYVRVVEEKEDGIVVRGAKFHTSMSVISNEIFVLPGRSLTKGEEDYAICFAVEPKTPGVKLICRPAIATEAALHPAEGSITRSRRMGETLTIFEDVFVPWDRVFIYKNVKAASKCALLFALFHRLSAVSYRSALAEHLIGVAMMMAEANGVQKASHIARDITDIIGFSEIQRVCALAAASNCNVHDPSGVAIPNKIITNVGKLYSNSNYLNVIQSLVDIAGGVAICAPSGDDYENPDLRPYISKYLLGAVDGDERFKLSLLLREIIALMIGEEMVIMIHAEGSMEASRIELYRSYKYEACKNRVKKMINDMAL